MSSFDLSVTSIPAPIESGSVFGKPIESGFPSSPIESGDTFASTSSVDNSASDLESVWLRPSRPYPQCDQSRNERKKVNNPRLLEVALEIQSWADNLDSVQRQQVWPMVKILQDMIRSVDSASSQESALTESMSESECF